MGNAVLTGALTQLGREHLSEEKCLFREVLLTAPDIDAQLFEEEIVPAIANPRQRITLYASSNDKALKRSADLAASRAGMAGEFLLVMDGIETVDVSDLDTDFLGHSYYGDHRLVVDDMRLVVLSHLPPKERGLKEAKKKSLTYWRFVP
jgi:esterase/lipase superfamily enzyme